jgi:Tol biopolymer transport system component
MTTPNPGITVITASGSDYTVPAGQSWVPSISPDGSLIVSVFEGPFEVEDDGTNRATGQIVGSFSDVEAVYPTASATKTG